MITTRDLPPTSRALPPTDRAYAAGRAAMLTASAALDPHAAGQGRGNAALRLLDEIAARDRTLREDVTPDLEPLNAGLENAEDFDEGNNDRIPEEEMEPYDPTIESSLKATVEGDETGITITPDEGETIVGVTEEDSGDLEVLLEDTVDVLLAAKAPRAKATVETHDDGSVTIHPDAGEVLDVSDMNGDIAVHVDEA